MYTIHIYMYNKKDNYSNLCKKAYMNIVSSSKYSRTFTFPHKRSTFELLSISGPSAPLCTFVLWNHHFVELGFLLGKHCDALAVDLITKGITQWITGESHMESNLGQDGAGWYKISSQDSERHTQAKKPMNYLFLNCG